MTLAELLRHEQLAARELHSARLEIGRYMQAARLSAGIDLSDIRSRTGLRQTLVAGIEQGRDWSYTAVRRLADCYSFYVVGRTGNSPPP